MVAIAQHEGHLNDQPRWGKLQDATWDFHSPKMMKRKMGSHDHLDPKRLTPWNTQKFIPMSAVLQGGTRVLPRF